ncbi:MAG: Smr/MutS family protein [Thermodesulfobacteriota bacterium]
MARARYPKKKIRKLTGEEYPFGGQAEEQASFAEMFDPARFDSLQNGYLRQEEPSPPSSPRSYPPPQETLDLHGFTAQEAEAKVTAFVNQGRRRSLRTLCVITGKGLHSPGGKAVLPDAVEQCLRLLKRQGAISDFRWQKREKAKSGALLVYL